MVSSCEVLAVGAHPDDVELGCGGLLARLAACGRRVGILDLTAGEAATRGDERVRRGEAAEAAAALGVAWRSCLSLPDGGLDAGAAPQRVALVQALRIAAPRAVLLPHPRDPHPDHGAAAELGRVSMFLAGVARWGAELGAPQRPRLALSYPGPRQLIVPVLAVDVGRWYAAKRAALAAHRSQFAQGTGVATHLASGHFLTAIEGRDRATGNTIGCELAEGFGAAEPVPGDELVWLLGGTSPCA